MPDVVPTMISAGEWAVTHPADCRITTAVLYQPGQADETGWGTNVRREVEEWVTRAAAADSWLAAHPPTIDWWPNGVMPMEIPEDDEIVSVMRAVNRDLGLPDRLHGLDSWYDGAILTQFAGRRPWATGRQASRPKAPRSRTRSTSTSGRRSRHLRAGAGRGRASLLRPVRLKAKAARTSGPAPYPHTMGRLRIAFAALAFFTATSSPAIAAPNPVVRVTLIGDSVATGVEWNHSAASILRAGIDLNVQVEVCRRLTGESCPFEGGRPSTLVDLAATFGPGLGPTVIVVAGYNEPEEAFAQSVEDSITALVGAGVTRIFWATLTAARPAHIKMNETIRAAAATHPQLRVVDWETHSRSHSDWFQTDGIHLTEAGGVAMATLLRSALAQPPVAPSTVAEPLPQPTAARRLTIVLSSKRLAVARFGRRYAARLLATGGTGPYRWNVVSGSFPRGLRLLADGRIMGTPARPGRTRLVLRVTDASGLTETTRTALMVLRSRNALEANR